MDGQDRTQVRDDAHLANLAEFCDGRPAAGLLLHQALDLAHAILDPIERLLGLDKLAQALARRRELVADGVGERGLDGAVLGLEALAEGGELGEVGRREQERRQGCSHDGRHPGEIRRFELMEFTEGHCAGGERQRAARKWQARKEILLDPYFPPTHCRADADLHPSQLK